MRGDVEKLDLLNKYNTPQTDLTSLLRPLFWLKRNPGAASDDGRGGAVDVILADGIHVRVWHAQWQRRAALLLADELAGAAAPPAAAARGAAAAAAATAAMTAAAAAAAARDGSDIRRRGVQSCCRAEEN